MLLSNQHGSPSVMIAPGFVLNLGLDGQGGDLGDGEPVYLTPPVTMTAAACRPLVHHLPANPGPASVGRRLREDLEAEFPIGCQCHNCLRGRHALKLV